MRVAISSLILATLAIAGIFGLIGSSGCGVVAAPVLVPAAVASNQNFQFQGKVVDDQGRPLEGVIAELTAQHFGWTPVEGGQTTSNKLLRQVNKDFSFDARGTNFTVAFSKEGYLPVAYRMDANQPHEVLVVHQTGNGKWNDPQWPRATGLTVVMISKAVPDSHVPTFLTRIGYENYTRANGVNLILLSRWDFSASHTQPVDLAKPIPEGMFYLTLVPGVAKPVDAKGTLDPKDINCPEEVTLHISGERSGFVRIVPKFGELPMLLADMAPEAGYAAELKIDHKRLLAMRKTPEDQVGAAKEYFYFRVKDGNDFRYGKGIIWWTDSGQVEFWYRLGVNAKVGDRQLVTHR